MNPKIAKGVTKVAFGAVVTFAIGLMIRAENHIDDKIDAHYDAKLEDQKTDQ